jgi:hypothetical protein
MREYSCGLKPLALMVRLVSQHYEVPAAFYKLVLGPWFKYSYDIPTRVDNSDVVFCQSP